MSEKKSKGFLTVEILYGKLGMNKLKNDLNPVPTIQDEIKKKNIQKVPTGTPGNTFSLNL